MIGRLASKVVVVTGGGTGIGLAVARRVVSEGGLDPWDAHVAAIADVAICPIRTLNVVKWQQPAAALDQPLHIIGVRDPGGQEPGA